MRDHAPPQYTLDVSGTNPNNRIQNELHNLDVLYVRVIATMKGVYHTNSLVVTDSNNTALQVGIDYVPFYLHDDATFRYNTDFHSLVLILNPLIKGQIRIEYQALGGYFERPDTELARSYTSILGRQKPNDWVRLLSPREDSKNPNIEEPNSDNRPSRIGVVLERLEDIRRAIAYADPQVYEALLENVNTSIPFVKCYKDMKILPARKPVGYFQFLSMLQNYIIQHPYVIYTDNCEWTRNSTQKFYIDTSYVAEPTTLYWEIYTDDMYTDLTDYLGGDLSGSFLADGSIVEISYTVPNIPDTYIGFSFFVGLKYALEDNDYIASTMPIQLPN